VLIALTLYVSSTLLMPESTHKRDQFQMPRPGREKLQWQFMLH